MNKAYRRLVTALAMIIIGMGLLWFGFFGLVDLKPEEGLTDEAVMERARDMGWIPLKEAIDTGEYPKNTGDDPANTEVETTTGD